MALLGARLAMAGGKQDYVQDGLAAAWDAECTVKGLYLLDKKNAVPMYFTSGPNLTGGMIVVSNSGTGGVVEASYVKNFYNSGLTVDIFVKSYTTTSWGELFGVNIWGPYSPVAIVFQSTQFRCYINQNNGNGSFTTSSAGEDHTLTISLEDGEEVLLYLDGAYVGKTSKAENWIATRMSMGGICNETGGIAGDVLACKIGRFHVYNRVLSSDEIAKNRAMDVKRFGLT